ncbi:MAG: DUF1207 domain-containing protein [Gemmatimonadales bacterium]|nr:DUF1207 domain-containing protein [Gemmatimonadales bacterium]
MSRIGTPVERALACAMLAGVSLPASGRAQDRFFPHVRSFELPSASPRVHGLVARVLGISTGESRFGSGNEAEVALGEHFPLLTLRRGATPIVLGFGPEVYGRFSLSDSKTSLISNDWLVSLAATLLGHSWDVTLEMSHESSHLGDEYANRFGAQRLDWSRETAAAWAAYRHSGWRISGTVSYALIDELRLDPAAAGLGLDFDARAGEVHGGHVRPVAGIFLEAAGQTAWKISSTARLGLGLRSDDLSRAIAISLIAHDGLSSQRQFYGNQSRYAGVELRLDL